MKKDLVSVEEKKKKTNLFIKIIEEYKGKVNIISRKITREQIKVLIDETNILDRFISNKTIVDAGSGNGILGFPLAINDPSRKVYLVEPRKKKSEFLLYVAERLKTGNVIVVKSGIEEFFKKNKFSDLSLISRGFPDYEKLIPYIKKVVSGELFFFTSMSKIKKIEKKIEKSEQSIYNVPFRDSLKLIHIRSVSRET